MVDKGIFFIGISTHRKVSLRLFILLIKQLVYNLFTPSPKHLQSCLSLPRNLKQIVL